MIVQLQVVEQPDVARVRLLPMPAPPCPDHGTPEHRLVHDLLLAERAQLVTYLHRHGIGVSAGPGWTAA